MVVIRLARGGAKKRRFSTSSSPTRAIAATAASIERVGFYNPIAGASEEGLRLSLDRISYWQDRGAKLSETVANLVKKAPSGRCSRQRRPSRR